MVLKNELYPIHFYGRVRGKCDGRLQNWPGIANERPKFLAMQSSLKWFIGVSEFRDMRVLLNCQPSCMVISCHTSCKHCGFVLAQQINICTCGKPVNLETPVISDEKIGIGRGEEVASC